MAKRVQLIRHIESLANAFIGLLGEITVDTTNQELRVHDGLTAGGRAAARKDLTTSPAATAVADGKMSAAQASKLAGIEASATGDQTGAEIKTLYEAEADTNEFSDALLTKLNGIETAATADQTGAEIKTAYEGEADTNAFTDALLTKLNGIDASASADFASGIIIAAFRATVPVGWTRDVSAGIHNAGIRVTNTTPADGGADAFSTVFTGSKVSGGTAITAANMPVHLHGNGTLASPFHRHGFRVASSGSAVTWNDGGDDNILNVAATIFGDNNIGSPIDSADRLATTGADATAVTGSTANAGSGTAHTHPVSLMNLKYLDVIVAQKD